MNSPSAGGPALSFAPGPVFAGVDGSDGALAAVRWAAGDAALRGQPLRLLHADGHGDAPEALERARVAALEERPELYVEVEAVHGDPATALTAAAARENGVLAVGRRGRSAAADLLLGSVSRAAAARGACPVVVVGGAPRAAGRVVVGVDGSDAGFGALDFAFEEARLRGGGLTVVQAVAGNIPYSTPDLVSAYVPEVELREAREQLSEWTARRRHRAPGMDVTMTARPGDPADVLLEAAGRAGLLVVGSRGRGRVRGLLLGSVSQTLLGHFHGPVAVIGSR